MPIVVFDISPGEVVVIQNEEAAACQDKLTDCTPLPELGLQVVEPDFSLLKDRE
jgi:hypothetical protein